MSKQALIVGAGLGGLTAAHALQKFGWETQIFEQAAEFSEVGAGIQLSPNATRILRKLGLLYKIRAASFEPTAASIRDGLKGTPLMHAPLKGFCERVYGAPYLHLYRPDLHAILAEGLNVSLGQESLGITPAHLDDQGQVIPPSLLLNRFENSADRLSCEDHLVVGADGLKSRLQAGLNGPENPRFTGQVAWRGLVQVTPELRRLIPADATVWAGPGQHVVTYYLRPNLLNFVAVTEQEDWQEEGWNLPGDPAELRSRFEGWHPAIGEVFAACQSVRRWALFDRPLLARWTDDQVALLGDAAHPTLPFLAQGAALAMEDAWALAKYAPDLKAYEGARKPRATKLQAWARSNAKLYHQTRSLDRLKLQISRLAFRGPQAHLLFWQIFSA